MRDAYSIEKINNVYNWKDFFETFQSKYLSEGSLISHYCLNHPEKTLGEVQETFSELTNCFANARLELTKIVRDFSILIHSASCDSSRYYKLSPELSTMREKITKIFYALDALNDPEITSTYYNNFCSFLEKYEFSRSASNDGITFCVPPRKYIDPDRGIYPVKMSPCFFVPIEVIKKPTSTPSSNPTQK